MSPFSKWLGDRLPPEKEDIWIGPEPVGYIKSEQTQAVKEVVKEALDNVEEHEYVVVKTLKSNSNGIPFHKSPDVSDSIPAKTAFFGSVQKGILHDDKWLKVGKCYLPMKIDGDRVLMRADEQEAQEVVLNGISRQSRVSRTIAAPTVRWSDIEAQLKPWEVWWSEANECPAYYNDIDGEVVYNLADTGKDIDEGIMHRAAYRFKGVIKASKPDARSVTKPKPSKPVPPIRPGIFYHVIGNLVVRKEPQMDALQADYVMKGAKEVEVFEWDSTRQWRKAWQPLAWNVKAGSWFWVRMNNDMNVALLRPGYLNDFRGPLQPVCLAVLEKDREHLGQFIKDGANVNVLDGLGFSPLMYAAQQGCIDTCVMLINAGADASVKCAGTQFLGWCAADFIARPQKAIIHALSDDEKGFSVEDLDMAMARLPAETRTLIEKTLDEIAASKAEQRRQAEETLHLESEKDEDSTDHEDEFANMTLADIEAKLDRYHKLVQLVDELGMDDPQVAQYHVMIAKLEKAHKTKMAGLKQDARPPEDNVQSQTIVEKPLQEQAEKFKEASKSWIPPEEMLEQKERESNGQERTEAEAQQPVKVDVHTPPRETAPGQKDEEIVAADKDAADNMSPQEKRAAERVRQRQLEDKRFHETIERLEAEEKYTAITKEQRKYFMILDRRRHEDNIAKKEEELRHNIEAAEEERRKLDEMMNSCLERSVCPECGFDNPADVLVCPVCETERAP